MINRSALLALLEQQLPLAVAGVGIAAGSCFVDRDSAVREGILPAINLKRGNDIGRNGGDYHSVRRDLVVSVDVYAVGETRRTVVDAAEAAIRDCLRQQVDSRPEVNGTTLDVNWDVEDLAVAFMAARLHINIDYNEAA